MPSKPFFLSGHKISLAFARHSFMHKPSVKGHGDLAIISRITKLALIESSLDLLISKKKFLCLANAALSCRTFSSRIFPVNASFFMVHCVVVLTHIILLGNSNHLLTNKGIEFLSFTSVKKYKFSHLSWKTLFFHECSFFRLSYFRAVLIKYIHSVMHLTQRTKPSLSFRITSV
ncbi:unnamed protein product [Caretta caretta]